MALKKQSLDKMAVILMGVIGFILFILSCISFKNMPDTCTDPIIYNGLTAILVLSAVMITLSATYGLCNARFGNCYKENTDGKVEIYYYIGVVLSIILCAISIMVLGKLLSEDACTKDANNEETKDGKTLKFAVGFTAGFSVLALLGCIGGIVYIGV